MTSLSYREKTLYASLVIELLVYGPYFFLHRQNSVNRVVGMIFAIIVLQTILQSVIAAFTRNRVTDERDRLIELRGYRAVVAREGRPSSGGRPDAGTSFPERLLWHVGHRGYHQDRNPDSGLPESTLMPAIRNQIRELRAMREMTQQELADRVGVTRQTVIAIEQDKYSPSLETAFKVAVVLGVPLEQCFQYDPHGKR
jgi:putative transcriptional regulator